MFESLSKLHAKYPWKSITKFMPIAKKHGFKDSDVKQFFNKNVIHDVQKQPLTRLYLPIYGRQHAVYQFDTLIQSKGASPPCFLIIINVNSRKAYAYPMKNKGKSEVLTALRSFVHDLGSAPKEMTSDQDTAYLSNDIITFMQENNIDYHTTDDDNHNILGIINRFIRTLRDLCTQRDFTIPLMKKTINAYNKTIHSSTGIAPNSFTSDDEDRYIDKMNGITMNIKKQKGFYLKPNTKVRIVLDTSPLSKKRGNLSKDYYVIQEQDDNGYLIRALDGSVAYYPRHKLVPLKTASNIKQAQTLKDGKRGVVERIEKYDSKNDKYTVVYDEGTQDTIPAKNLRETRPTHLGPLEIQYWKQYKGVVPQSIARYKGL